MPTTINLALHIRDFRGPPAPSLQQGLAPDRTFKPDIWLDLFLRKSGGSGELANRGLLVVASDVVPLDVVVVEVVEHGQADLVLGAVLIVVSVIGLGQLLLRPEIKIFVVKDIPLAILEGSSLPSGGGPVSRAGLPTLAPA